MLYILKYLYNHYSDQYYGIQAHLQSMREAKQTTLLLEWIEELQLQEDEQWSLIRNPWIGCGSTF